MNQYNDIEIICICGKDFIWTSGEQNFLNALVGNWKIPSVTQPKRCPSCRQKKKEERERKENQSY